MTYKYEKYPVDTSPAEVDRELHQYGLNLYYFVLSALDIAITCDIRAICKW